jgi:hypothetical protein
MNHIMNRTRPEARAGRFRSAPAAMRPQSGAADTRQMPQDARKRYERYLVLARDTALTGDRIGAENYYQHAEHYLRAMTANVRDAG